jgi:hypothetical protein
MEISVAPSCIGFVVDPPVPLVLVQSLAGGYFGRAAEAVRMMAKKMTCSDQLFKWRRFERDIIVLCLQ